MLVRQLGSYTALYLVLACRFFRFCDNGFHYLFRCNLSVCPEAGRSVQIVGKVGSGVCWYIAFSTHGYEVHIPEGVDYFVRRETHPTTINLFIQIRIEWIEEQAVEDVPMETADRMLDLNCKALMDMCYLCLRGCRRLRWLLMPGDLPSRSNPGCLPLNIL